MMIWSTGARASLLTFLLSFVLFQQSHLAIGESHQLEASDVTEIKGTPPSFHLRRLGTGDGPYYQDDSDEGKGKGKGKSKGKKSKKKSGKGGSNDGGYGSGHDNDGGYSPKPNGSKAKGKKNKGKKGKGKGKSKSPCSKSKSKSVKLTEVVSFFRVQYDAVTSNINGLDSAGNLLSTSYNTVNEDFNNNAMMGTVTPRLVEEPSNRRFLTITHVKGYDTVRHRNLQTTISSYFEVRGMCSGCGGFTAGNQLTRRILQEPTQEIDPITGCPIESFPTEEEIRLEYDDQLIASQNPNFKRVVELEEVSQLPPGATVSGAEAPGAMTEPPLPGSNLLDEGLPIAGRSGALLDTADTAIPKNKLGGARKGPRRP